MSITDIGIIVGFVATLITVISSVIILVRHFDKLENNVDRIRDGLNQNIKHSNNIISLLSVLVGLQSKTGAINKEDFGIITGRFAEMGQINEVHPNPITQEQTDRLNGYIRRAKEGGIFTTAEVQEYNALVKTLAG